MEMRRIRRRVVGLAIASCLAPLLGPSLALAQADWPARTMKVVVPYPAGGTADAMGRMVAGKLAKAFPQASVIVENISGGATVPGAMAVLRDPADGHTLFMASDNTLNINHWLLKDARYDGDRDFTPVTVLNTYPHWLIVNPQGPYDSFDALVQAIRANPGKISISVNTIGGAAYLALDNWRRRNGLEFEIVPYRGSPPAVADLIGGHTDAHVDVVGSSIAHARGARVLPVAILQDTPLAEFPKAVAQDSKDPKALAVQSNLSVVVRAGTPPALLERLYAALQTGVKDKDFAGTLDMLSLDAVMLPPAEARTFLAQETRRYGALVEQSGLEKQ
ncbi:Bug family tripartite tricarboxylate transporter substrate binding protein [Bordetella bronchiseptica]|uniref:Bug family tripartite tricarboxylate transporter substrate binding protein n=1 Tax=Bordetella bronchiseptica TaxID=518 RepID=UPI0009B834D7|nr:tripartite tricarboxylate transporter substrate binding protein [Bordetella bronchiseptica]